MCFRRKFVWTPTINAILDINKRGIMVLFYKFGDSSGFTV